MTYPEKQQRHAPGAEAAATSMAADAVCGKTARACDGCVRRRARWYCAADDAFLCQGCDSSVHSANPLARRHQRIRLKTAGSSPPPLPSCGMVLQVVKPEEALVPAWLTGFKRKARTPRSQSQAKAANTGSRSQASTTVPDLVEMSVDENEEEVEEEEEHALLYRVPIFDPVLAEFCSPPLPLDDANASSVYDAKSSVTAELSDCAPTTSASSVDDAADEQLASFLPTDMELAEFAANMESLLSGAVDGSDDSFCMEKLGLVDPMDHDGGCCMRSAGSVKAEQQAEGDRDHERYDELDDVDLSRETLELSFELGSPINGDDREPKEEKTDPDAAEAEAAEQGSVKTAILRLDYEAIIAAWANQGASPWTDGKRPQVSTDGCWPDYMGMWMHGGVQTQGGGGEGGMAAHNDVGREARVSRYREKRRTRLFSKKIRYEVRKLNAEKRPRMKGRFVKRAPCAAMGVAH